MSTERTVLKLAGGLEIAVPDGETAEAVYWRHCAMSVGEGICPNHQKPLEPVASNVASVIGSYCYGCRAYWSYDRTDQRTAWSLGYDPHTGRAMAPDWVA